MPSTRLLLALVLGVAGALGAHALAGQATIETEAPGRAVLRGIGRPFVLPFLWSRVTHAETRGDVDRTLLRFEEVLAWLPRWTDGQIVQAWRVATRRRNAARPDDDDTSVRRLASAVAWLDERARRAAGAEDRAELWAASAFLLQLEGTRTRERQDLARVLLRFDPVEGADARLANAERERPEGLFGEHRVFLVFDLLLLALRTGETESARRLVAIGRERIDSALARDPLDDDLPAARRALDTFEAWLDEPTPAARAALDADPYLRRLAPVLR